MISKFYSTFKEVIVTKKTFRSGDIFNWL